MDGVTGLDDLRERLEEAKRTIEEHRSELTNKTAALRVSREGCEAARREAESVEKAREEQKRRADALAMQVDTLTKILEDERSTKRAVVEQERRCATEAEAEAERDILADALTELLVEHAFPGGNVPEITRILQAARNSR